MKIFYRTFEKVRQSFLSRFEQARKLQATLVRNYDRLTDSLTGVKCRATSVAKNGEKLRP